MTESISFGDINGSSPWTFTTNSAPISSKASMILSVPERHFSDVITTGAEILSANSAISMLSVKITVFSANSLFLHAW